MALTIANMRTRTVAQPPRVLIHGPTGLGKTTLGCEFPAPFLLDVEGRRPVDLAHEDVPGFDGDQLATYQDVIDALSSLYNDDHSFQTLIFDTLDRFEPIVWQKACDDNGWKSIEEPGWGKGYTETASYWRTLLDWFIALRRDRGMAIVLIAHSEIKSIPSPTIGPHPSYDVRLHKTALSMITYEMDAIFFMNRDASAQVEKIGKNQTRTTHATGGGTRWVYCDGRPAFTAKGLPGMPDKFIYTRGQGFNEIAKYLPGAAPAAEKKEAA